MRCPFCAHLESKVTDSRLSAVGDVTRRRRECKKCARRFTTYERVEEILPLVGKKDGRREPFDRVKLLAGLQRACQKRDIPVTGLDAIVDSRAREPRKTQAAPPLERRGGVRPVRERLPLVPRSRRVPRGAREDPPRSRAP